jgi:hypothetical protein
MNILILESDPYEQKNISKKLRNHHLSYEPTVARAINRLGVEEFNFALIDADLKRTTYSWEELADFLKQLNIDYSVFSSNGKVGMKNGKSIISIHDIPKEVNSRVEAVC